MFRGCASPDSTCCRWSARRRRSSAGSTTTASTSWCTRTSFQAAARSSQGWSRARIPFIYVRAVHRIAEQIEALVRERRIDAIFAAMPFSWVAATPVARRLGVPIIWRAGGTEISTAEKMILAAWAAVSPPDLLVCCGQAVHDRFARLVDAPAVVINNGVDTEALSPRRRRRAPVSARGRAAGRRLRGAPGAAEAPRGLPAHGRRDRALSPRRPLPGRRRGQPAAALRGDGRDVARRRAGPIPRLRRGHAVVLRRVRHPGAAVALRGVPQRRARGHGDAARAGGVGRGRHARRGRATSARRWCSRSATSPRSRPPCAG